MGTVTHHEPCSYPGTSGAPVIWYLVSHKVGETMFAPGGCRIGSAWMGDRLGRETWQTNLPGHVRALQDQISSIIELVGKLHGPRMAGDGLHYEGQGLVSNRCMISYATGLQATHIVKGCPEC